MVLVLPIKRKWFDMIKSGEKKEEYREIKPYYDNRIGNAVAGISFKHCHPDFIKKLENNKEFDVIFRNGYSYDSPHIWCICTFRRGTGKEEWGAIPNKEYYILDIKRIDHVTDKN